MGASASSRQRMGERVTAGRRKMEHALVVQEDRVKSMQSLSPQTMDVVADAVAASFKATAPFLEGTLMAAFKANPKRIEDVVMASCKNVLSAPIRKGEFEWLKQYVLPSSIWLLPTSADDGRFMFENLMDIAKQFAVGIEGGMDTIYRHLTVHEEWHKVMAIKNEAAVQRQDDKRVGLLSANGITAILESKQYEDAENLKSFIEGNLAVSMLTATAKQIDPEFQNEMKVVMGRFGDCKPGPIKRVDRSVSKIENDYNDAAFPKAAKLLDLVRCSVAFNTVSELVAGYEGLIKYIESGTGSMKLARVKNGFLNDADGGYRDLKLNVIFQSTVDPEVRMICEIQLILNQYLLEKEKMHKLYSIIRDEGYYQMVVKCPCGDVECKCPCGAVTDCAHSLCLCLMVAVTILMLYVTLQLGMDNAVTLIDPIFTATIPGECDDENTVYLIGNYPFSFTPQCRTGDVNAYNVFLSILDDTSAFNATSDPHVIGQDTIYGKVLVDIAVDEDAEMYIL